MSQISSAHKIENMNKLVVQQLQSILDFCERFGHQPEPNGESGAIMLKVQHLIFVRSLKGISIPKEIPSLYAKIRQFPTAARYKRRELKIKEIAQQDAQLLALEQKQKRIQKLTSHNLNIFKFICGNKRFECFLNTDIDPIATKAVLDYFYAIYYNQKFSPFIGKSVFSQRDRYLIKLYVGDYTDEDVDDMKKTLKYRTKAKYMPQVPEKDYQQLVAKIEQEEPLTHKEIGYLTYMTYTNIGHILCAAHRDFFKAFKNFGPLLDSYINGDVAGVMSKIPEKFATLYKYQQDNKIQDIPTDVLNSTGKTLMEFFVKSSKQY